MFSCIWLQLLMGDTVSS